MSFLIGSTFPLSLIRHPVRIEPRPLDELKQRLRQDDWASFWGHENTVAAADSILGLGDLNKTVRPQTERPALTLNENQQPILNGTSYTECWILSPDYAPGFRPQVGEEVTAEKIVGWQVLQIVWEESFQSGTSVSTDKIQTSSNKENETILLTALGAQLRKTEYALNTSKAEGELSPIALLKLLSKNEMPRRVIALVTKAAEEKTWPTFESEIEKIIGRKPEKIDIPDGRNALEWQSILESVAIKIPDNAKLVLELTQGYRHFAFLFYAFAPILKTLREVEIAGAYYGMVEGKPADQPAPILDLKVLLRLPEWFYALRVFRESGTAKQLADALIKSSFTDLGRSLNAVSGYYESGLPLELGKSSADLVSEIENLNKGQKIGFGTADAIPLLDEILNLLKESSANFAFSPCRSLHKGNWKEKLPLDDKELLREANLIEFYWKRRQYPLALGLMREWVVSRVLQCASSTEVKWLKVKRSEKDPSSSITREQSEQALGELSAKLKSEAKVKLSEEENKWAKFWDDLTQLRNPLHHHGMRQNLFDLNSTQIQRVEKFWNECKTLESKPPITL